MRTLLAVLALALLRNVSQAAQISSADSGITYSQPQIILANTSNSGINPENVAIPITIDEDGTMVSASIYLYGHLPSGQLPDFSHVGGISMYDGWDDVLVVFGDGREQIVGVDDNLLKFTDGTHVYDMQVQTQDLPYSVQLEAYNFGMPEPSGVVLAVMAGTLLLVSRRRWTSNRRSA